jgi:lambda repressor-like predicted transcriptional regulator
MKERCENTNAESFPNYGARGITVCEKWSNSFVAFLNDMGPRPSKKHSIDRKENCGNYEPGNCRWATRKEQNSNSRSVILAEFKGKTMCAADLARRVGMSPFTLYTRLKLGLTPEQAISLPLKKHPHVGHGKACRK